jgi:hypothetical protein
MHFRQWIEADETRLLNANFCKRHLLCQACAVRRAGRMNESYLPKVQQVVGEHPHLVPAMVTLTVKNGPDLHERVTHLKESWKRMGAAKRKAASGSERHKPIEWNKVLGSLRALEVTRSKDQEWHPHFHCFVLLTSYIDQKKFSEEWKRFTGDSVIVGVTKCKNGFDAGLREVLKYSCKFSSMTAEQTYEVFRTLHGSRLIDPQGILRGVKEPDIDSDDIEGLTGPYHDFIASWIHDQQRYHITPKSTGPLRYLSHPHRQRNTGCYDHTSTSAGSGGGPSPGGAGQSPDEDPTSSTAPPPSPPLLPPA